MKEKHFLKWQKTRKKGKVKFVLVSGLAWGLPMFLIMTFIVNKPELGHISLVRIGLNALIWAASGVGVGYFMWRYSEQSYMKELEGRRNQ